MKYKIGDTVEDADGSKGMVCIAWNDGDLCVLENDAAHPEPKIVESMTPAKWTDGLKKAHREAFHQGLKKSQTRDAEQIEQLLDIESRISCLEGRYKTEIAGLKAERDRLKNEVDFLRNLIKISTVAKKVEKPGGGYQPIDDEDLEAAYQQAVKTIGAPPPHEE